MKRALSYVAGGLREYLPPIKPEMMANKYLQRVDEIGALGRVQELLALYAADCIKLLLIFRDHGR
jgi:hypothetical protein